MALDRIFVLFATLFVFVATAHATQSSSVDGVWVGHDRARQRVVVDITGDRVVIIRAGTVAIATLRSMGKTDRAARLSGTHYRLDLGRSVGRSASALDTLSILTGRKLKWCAPAVPSRRGQGSNSCIVLSDATPPPLPVPTKQQGCVATCIERSAMQARSAEAIESDCRRGCGEPAGP